jgi:hypothetical protein
LLAVRCIAWEESDKRGVTECVLDPDGVAGKPLYWEIAAPAKKAAITSLMSKKSRHGYSRGFARQRIDLAPASGNSHGRSAPSTVIKPNTFLALPKEGVAKKSRREQFCASIAILCLVAEPPSSSKSIYAYALFHV